MDRMDWRDIVKQYSGIELTREPTPAPTKPIPWQDIVAKYTGMDPQSDSMEQAVMEKAAAEAMLRGGPEALQKMQKMDWHDI
eukprot:8050883-Prorocentrum_lima.AAC.1